MGVRRVKNLKQPSELTGADKFRMFAVIVSEIFCLVGTAVGTGILAEPTNEVGDGRFAADSSLITPAGPAFSIWSVIYTGLLAYTIWHTLPRNAATARARTTGWWASASMVLNATWLIVVANELFWLSVPVIILLGYVLFMLMWRLRDHKPDTWTQRLVVDATFGAYLGWVSVATCANIAATLAGDVLPRTGFFAVFLATLVIVGVVYLAYRYLGWFGPRLSIMYAMAWGLGWISLGRMASDPRSLAIAFVAGAAAIAILAETTRRWWLIPSSQR